MGALHVLPLRITGPGRASMRPPTDTEDWPREHRGAHARPGQRESAGLAIVGRDELKLTGDLIERDVVGGFVGANWNGAASVLCR